MWFNNKIAWLTVWGVSSSIAVFSEETATAAETWHHHYDNNDYDGSDQHTDNDANCIAEISNKSNKYLDANDFKIKYPIKKQQHIKALFLAIRVCQGFC